MLWVLKVSTFASYAVFVGVGIAAFLAYFAVSFDPVTQIARDGLGRKLSELPTILSILLPAGTPWAGWLWWAADCVWFFGGIFLGIRLHQFGNYRPHPAPP
jgi:hypothetical protein